MKIKGQNPLKQNQMNLRISSEKILLGVFAAFSLMFALFYAFGHTAAHAGSSDLSAITPTTIEEKTVSAENPAETNAVAASAADVVTKALAFKASLTTAQQATLEKTYTPALARKWSNLPCGSGCRNGIQFSTLTSDQLALALQVIQAASGTTANEGSDEFNQIRLADAYLGANGGGSGYSSGIYFISFLNTPTTTGAWMLQFGGHHYAANIGFNNGHFVSTTPYFMGVEPTTFTTGGATYSPLEQERGAFQNMLASLTTAQLTTARLSQTFSDVTMSPGETNGGNGTFPATRVGIAVSTLSDAQKLLVLEAIKPYVKDVDDTVAANLLTIYQNELNNTYIAYTGAGTSGTPSSFLTTNTNYVRIDGTSAWVEFICQTGAVFRNAIHYHTIWRDRQRDYGADLSLTAPLDTTTTATTVQSPFDFDGDGKTDIGIFRPDSGAWWINASSTSATSAVQFGQSSDKLVPADYTGDGKTDIAVFRPSTGFWYILRSDDNSFYGFAFGSNGDIPAPADFDGDGKFDQAVFRPSNAAWYIKRSSDGGVTIQSFGVAEDQPVAADYDGDGKDDIAIFRPSTSAWWIARSSDGVITAVQFGQSGDKTVSGDYTGDGKTDIAFYRPSTGYWYILRSNDNSFYGFPFGSSGDIPTPGDYDGDGKADAAVFRSANAAWYLQRSTSGTLAVQFGVASDAPIPNAFVR